MYGEDILCGISKVPFEIPHKLDMSMARWRLKSPRSLSGTGTSAHPTMVRQVNIYGHE